MPARLNLFTPLPPVRSEIGNHTLLVAEALRDWADVTLWTSQAEAPESDAGLPVVRYDPAAMDWPRLNRADASVYNIGNNATFHRAIFDVARQAPGIVILHDTRLQHFFARYSETPGPNRAFYLSCMHRAHGAAGLADAYRWLAGELPLSVLVERYPMTAAALDNALAAIVHNPAEAARLAQQTRVPVFHLPLACSPGPVPARASAGATLRLILFGFMGDNRRIGPILDVVSTMSGRVRLDLYGVIDDPVPIDAQIEALGLVGRVTRHGYVAEATLQQALSHADLAINLRWPTMGEASASQLRIFAAGLPSIVTRTGWYAALPADAVFFVEPDREAEMLRAHLDAWWRDPAPFLLAGRRGRAYVAAGHAPEIYAAGLLGIVHDVAGLHGRRGAIDLSRNAAQVLMEMTDASGVALYAGQLGTAIRDAVGAA